MHLRTPILNEREIGHLVVLIKSVPDIDLCMARKEEDVSVTAAHILEQFSESYSSPSAFLTQLVTIPSWVVKVWANVI